MKKTFLAFTILLLILTGCKKCPEGGFYANSHATFNKEMTKAESWDLAQYSVNGIDSTNFIVSNNDASERKGYVKFFKYSRDNYYQCAGRSSELHLDYDSILLTDGKSGWYTLKNGVKIRYVLTPNGKVMRWKILRYKRTEMILGGDANNYNYRIVLKKH